MTIARLSESQMASMNVAALQTKECVMHKKIYALSTLAFIFLSHLVLATDYFVHPTLGNDQHAGTSMIAPIRTLEKASALALQPGDAILLAAGHTFNGSLALEDLSGAAYAPIRVGSYAWGAALADPRAIIDARDYLNGLLIRNCSHIEVENLIVTANGGGSKQAREADMRCGVLVTTSRPGTYQGITLRNLLIKDIFFEDPGFQRGKDEVRTANGTQAYGWGIRFINRTPDAIMKDLSVFSCTVRNVAHTGIKFTARGQTIVDIEVHNNRVLATGGPGIQMSGIRWGRIWGNYVNRSGSPDDSRKWGRGSGLWTWGSSDVIIEKNYFLNANGPGDSAGCHIDFNCTNVVVQYNFSANNAGGFCEILGNNHNCAYRYNISVNDGHRVKGENGAFQEGKTFWLSGYVGRAPRNGPYNSYFYNNTIYVSEDIVSKIAVTKTAAGILVANNIFCIAGESQAVLGDQYNPEKGDGGDVEHVVFENNLFLKRDIWPKEVLIQPGDEWIGDPQLTKGGGLNIIDYIPRNSGLVKDKGIHIPRIPKDTIGLSIGLSPQSDILGRKITGKPDMGAIELE